ADQLVVLVDLVGRLARRVPQLRVEQRPGDRTDEVRLADRGLLVAIREVPPHLVLLEQAADVDVRVAALLRLVAVQAEGAAVGRAEQEPRRQILLDVLADHRVVLEVLVDLALEFVAARFAEHLALHARRRHFGALTDRAEEYFFERAVVDVEAGAARAFGRGDALYDDAVLAAVTVGAVAGLRAGAVAADVDARHADRRRHREQRPQVARVGNLLELFELEVLLHARRGGVDDRRIAGDRHRLLQRCDRELHIDRGGEA